LSPELSAIAVGDTAECLRPLLRSLDRQTAKGRLELVVVAPADAHDEIERHAPSGLAGLRLVDCSRIEALPPARVQGILAASAPVVTLTETHCFPAPDWAAALIERHREDCAAVGPTFDNANPATARSWANLVIDYGPFLAGPQRREPEASEDLPGHNSSYKRDVLLAAYGDELADPLEFESVLHADLRRRGYRLVLEPRARVAHVNVTSIGSWAPERWCAGRLYGGTRSREWPVPRRAAYALAWPLIVAVRLPRVLRHARSIGRPGLTGRVTAPVFAGLVLQSLGEAAGYLAGPGSASHDIIDIELHRFDHLTRRDVPTFGPPEKASTTA